MAVKAPSRRSKALIPHSGTAIPTDLSTGYPQIVDNFAQTVAKPLPFRYLNEAEMACNRQPKEDD